MIMVASYCRVSTDKEDQTNSFEAQQRYFREYIDRKPDWELYAVYADEGITGTSTKKRVQFNRMIADAHLGRFQLILTKEVSRFSRNILDTISYTRELKGLGVGVLFMNDGINTMEPDSELRLSIMGSIAQEESRKTSDRVKWGQTRQMERGVVFGRSMLGYDVERGKMTINPEGAEIVRQIFHKYGIEKKGTSVIARELREAGIKSYSGRTIWNNTHIVKILKNEKYVGDLVQKKTYTPDYLSHSKKYNHGEEPQVVIPNHHEPIIDRELWDIVQQELKRRNLHGELASGHGNRYVFSGKIKCGECGQSFVSRKKKRKDGTSYKKWMCYTATVFGKAQEEADGTVIGCDIGRSIRDEVAMEILKEAIRTLRMDKAQIIQRVMEVVFKAIQYGEERAEEDPSKIQNEIAQINEKKEYALDAFFSKSITKEEMRMMNERYDRELASLEDRLQKMKERKDAIDRSKNLRAELKNQIESIIMGDSNCESFYKNLLHQMVVHRDGHIEVMLNLLPMKWFFLLEQIDQSAPKNTENRCEDVTVSYHDSSVNPPVDPQCRCEKNEELQGFAPRLSYHGSSVPMSVSSPWSSGQGMEKR